MDRAGRPVLQQNKGVLRGNTTRRRLCLQTPIPRAAPFPRDCPHSQRTVWKAHRGCFSKLSPNLRIRSRLSTYQGPFIILRRLRLRLRRGRASGPSATSARGAAFAAAGAANPDSAPRPTRAPTGSISSADWLPGERRPAPWLRESRSRLQAFSRVATHAAPGTPCHGGARWEWGLSVEERGAG